MLQAKKKTILVSKRKYTEPYALNGIEDILSSIKE